MPLTKNASTRSPFGQLMIEYRTAAGLSQEELGDVVTPSLSTRSIAGYEAAKSKPEQYRLPHPGNLRGLSLALNLTPEQHDAFLESYETTQQLKRGTTTPRTGGAYIEAGREDHLATLRQAWDDANRGNPQLVLIGGDSGIGKSSLVRHVCDSIAATSPQVMIAWGEASSTSSHGEPYLAMRRAFDHILVPPAVSSSIPGRYPSRPTLSDEQVDDLIRQLPALSGVLVSDDAILTLASSHDHLDESAVKTVLKAHVATDSALRWDAFCNLLIRYAQMWPLVLVLEDLHWAGVYTCQLITHLTRTLRGHTGVRLLVVATYRNHELLPEANGEPHCMQQAIDDLMPLEHVTGIQMNHSTALEPGSQFIREALSGAGITPANTDAFVADVYERTAGHPLFTLELLNYLTRDGETAEDLSAIERQGLASAVPRSLNVISDRLNHVGSSNLRLLTVASVMGEMILPETLAAVVDLPLNAVLDALDYELVERHGLLRYGDPANTGQSTDVTYQFTHAIFREHLYQRLPAHRRRRLHKQIADHLFNLESRLNLRLLTLIDEHYANAEDWANAAMTSHYLATLWTERMDWELSRSTFDRAESYAQKISAPHRLWLIRADRLSMKRNSGDFTGAIALAERIFEQTRYTDWPDIRAIAHHHLGEVCFDMGKLEEAEHNLELAVKDYLISGNLNRAGAAEAMLSHNAYRTGRYDVSRSHAEKALEHTRGIENSWVRPEALLSIANCDADLGRYAEAISRYRENQELGRQVGKVSNRIISQMNTALCLSMLGDYAEALDVMEAVLDEMASHDSSRLNGPAYLYLGLAHEGLGQMDAAQQAYEESERVRLHYPKNPTLNDTRAGLLRVAIHRADAATVRDLLEKMTRFMDELGVAGIEDVARVLISMAKGRAFLGDEKGYASTIREAHALIQERANRIKDPSFRESFLTHVPANVELARLFGAL